MKSQKVAIRLIIVLLVVFNYTSCKKSSINQGGSNNQNSHLYNTYKKGNFFVKVDKKGKVSRNGTHLGKVTKDGKVFKSNKQVGRINQAGKIFKNGKYIGKLADNKVFNKNQELIGRLQGNKVFKGKKQIGQAKHLSQKQLTMLYFFGFFD